VDAFDVISDFTSLPASKDESLDVMAPGEDLWGPYGWPNDNTVAFWSGTSFSAGIVSGAVALAIEVDPARTPDILKDIVVTAVDPAYDDKGKPFKQGLGRINLQRVVQQ
jgi:subtilisin family serine protease